MKRWLRIGVSGDGRRDGLVPPSPFGGYGCRYNPRARHRHRTRPPVLLGHAKSGDVGLDLRP